LSKKIAITLDPKTLIWVRRKAADANTSVSKLIEELLKKEGSASYWRASEEWKRLPHDLGVSIDTSKLMTREEVHERR
jgi:hypothetical protein